MNEYKKGQRVMVLRSMQDFLKILKGKSDESVAVSGAADDHVLESVCKAEEAGFVKAILIDKADEMIRF